MENKSLCIFNGCLMRSGSEENVEEILYGKHMYWV